MSTPLAVATPTGEASVTTKPTTSGTSRTTHKRQFTASSPSGSRSHYTRTSPQSKRARRTRATSGSTPPKKRIPHVSFSKAPLEETVTYEDDADSLDQDNGNDGETNFSSLPAAFQTTGEEPGRQDERFDEEDPIDEDDPIEEGDSAMAAITDPGDVWIDEPSTSKTVGQKSKKATPQVAAQASFAVPPASSNLYSLIGMERPAATSMPAPLSAGSSRGASASASTTRGRGVVVRPVAGCDDSSSLKKQGKKPLRITRKK
ncbi:hypothetical protein FRC11_001627 [Ceratobasidium sp. 423]|nr:hypothetical protein FRC11_001627 [Ceratobasidium sp. 423]